MIDLRPFAFDGDGVCAVVTTRHGGVSEGRYASLNLGDHVGDDHVAVMQNRDLVAAALGVPRLTVPDQQHTATVALVDAALAGAGHAGADESRVLLPATDGLVTDLPGVALSIMVADCTPVVLFDPVRRAVGAAHCGRNGVFLGVLPATVGRMEAEYGTDPGDLRVGIGPGICRSSYEVDDELAARMEEHFPGLGFIEPGRPGHHQLDIPAAVRHQLTECGVPSAQVDGMDYDTLTGTETWFSHRSTSPAACGRFMALIVLQPT